MRSLGTRSKARKQADPTLTKVEREAKRALAELRRKATYSVSFRCEPAFAIEDQSEPIRLVAHFSAVNEKSTDADDLEPVVRWLDKEAPLERVRLKAESSILGFESKQAARLFASDQKADDLETEPLILLLYPNKNKQTPAVAMFRLMVLKRAQVEGARQYLIEELKRKES